VGEVRVADVMSRQVRTLGRNDVLKLADDVMQMARIRHLPVLDEDGALAGIVTQRDLFRGALARALGYGQTAQDRLLGMLRVKDVMTNHVETCSPDTPLAEAGRMMSDRKIGCLVVVDAAGTIAGILTEADFVRHVIAGAHRGSAGGPSRAD
jgi:CBS domain-containing membrane protein